MIRRMLLSSLICFFLNTFPALAEWRQMGPFGGNVESIAVDPRNPSALLAATRNGLVYRSENSGETWAFIPFPRAFSATLRALAIHPQESSTFYVGISDDDRSKSGVYATSDAGVTWRLLEGTGGEDVFAVTIWNRDPRIIAAGTGTGVRLTRDGGRTWDRISPAGNAELQPVVSLAFDPFRSDIIYAGTPHLPWRTLDGGASWNSIHVGLIDDSDIFSIQVDPRSPLRLLAGACSGVYRSIDGGNRWTKLLGIPGISRRTYVVGQDPADPKVIFAGTNQGLWKTTNDGRTWRQLSNTPTRSFAIDPRQNGLIYVATEAGIGLSTDGAETMAGSNTGFVNRRLTDVLFSGDSVFASTAYESDAGGLFRMAAGEGGWKQLSDPARVLQQSTVFLAGDSSALFAAGRQAMARSLDGGITWKRVPWDERVTINALHTAGPKESRWLLAGTSQGLFRSDNHGLTWNLVQEAAVDAIFASADGSSFIFTTAAQAWISHDEGQLWSAAALPGRDNPVYDIALRNGGSSSVLIAATARGVYRSVDDAASWTLVAGGMTPDTASAAAFSADGRDLYLSQYENLYLSSDTGLSWRRLDNRGLENAPVRSLHIDSTRNHIFAVTASRGVFIRDLKPAERTVQ